jgi:23S rRNA (guanosine2251-2'-O)-methyltransferase
MTDGKVWIWGRHPVLEALRTRRASELLVATGRKPAPIVRDVLEEARRQGVSIREARNSEFEGIAPGANTQGVAALVHIPLLESLDDVLATAFHGTLAPFILILDQIQDPHNFGALLRTADATGVHAVVVPDRRSAPLSGTVAKTSAGALSHVPLLEVKNLVQALEQLKRDGVWIAGLDGASPLTVYEADLTVPLALVIGGEGGGLRRLTREHCDLLVSLPMQGSIESLNASVAGSVAMYEAVRQRDRHR